MGGWEKGLRLTGTTALKVYVLKMCVCLAPQLNLSQGSPLGN